MEYAITISGEIGSWWNGVTADYVRYHLAKHQGEEVHVGFCSLGGSVKDGLEMNQAFKDHGNVHAHAFAMNASASTLAMLGCKTIDIVKNSFFLIHNASMWIDKWESQNKEQIDQYIKELTKTRTELETIDDVLCQMYVDRCKKSKDEVKEQMNRGTWMSAEKALEWGLVDSIREDKKAENFASNVFNKFSNNYSTQFKDSGIPPFESANSNINKGVEDIVNKIADNDGNPTPNFLQKTWEGIKSLFVPNQQAQENPNPMKKIFASVCALLAMADGIAQNEDGSFTLTEEQLSSVNNEMDALKQKVTDAENAKKTAEDSLDAVKAEKESLTQKVADLEQQVKNLKAAPAVNPDPKPAAEPENYEGFTVGELFDKL